MMEKKDGASGDQKKYLKDNKMDTIYKSNCSDNKQIEIFSFENIGVIESEPEVIIQIRDFDYGTADFVVLDKNKAIDMIKLLTTFFSIKDHYLWENLTGLSKNDY